eukprot:1097867-Rhodomonas_salina.1
MSCVSEDFLRNKTDGVASSTGTHTLRLLSRHFAWYFGRRGVELGSTSWMVLFRFNGSFRKDL